MRFFGLKIISEYGVRVFNGAGIAAGEEIHKAGVAFRISVDAGMAFCKKQQHRAAAIGEYMFNGAEKGCPRCPDSRFHGRGQSFGIPQGGGIAVGIAGDEVMSDEIKLLKRKRFL